MKKNRLIPSSTRSLWAIGLLLLVAASAIVLNNRRSLTTMFDMTRLADRAMPELLQRIGNFHRVITRNGKRILEVSAKRADYFRDEKTILIIEPSLVFYDNGRRAGTITGNEGRLTMNGGAIGDVELVGTVILELGEFQLFTENLVYHKNPDSLHAKGLTELRSPEMKLVGRDLLINIDDRSLVVNDGVTIQIEAS